MKIYKDCDGVEHDLDDPNFGGSDYASMAVGTARCECIRELGWALMYFKYLEPDIDWGEQAVRVELLCQELAKEDRAKNDNEQFWRTFLFRIRDEIENLC